MHFIRKHPADQSLAITLFKGSVVVGGVHSTPLVTARFPFEVREVLLSVPGESLDRVSVIEAFPLQVGCERRELHAPWRLPFPSDHEPDHALRPVSGFRQRLAGDGFAEPVHPT